LKTSVDFLGTLQY